VVLLQQNKLDDALPRFREAARLEPGSVEALNGLAWLLATHPRAEMRNGAEAVRLAERACELSGGKDARFCSTLDAAYAEAGRFPDALRTAEKARDLALAAGRKELADAAEARLGLYRKQQPFHQ
jgi:Flp pilus assembly protein TadD